jgi:hypothetical protein
MSANAQSGKPSVTAEMYARVFDGMPEGKLVLEDLVARFAHNPFVRGGLEGDRATCFRAGQLSVPTFIMNQINRAAGVAVSDEE